MRFDVKWLYPGQVGENLFEVKSSSDSATCYLVDTSVGSCSCPYNRSTGRCKHAAAVRSRLPTPEVEEEPEAGDQMKLTMLYIATGKCPSYEM